MALFKERLACPVCKAKLGERFKDEIFSAHCDECKATFVWHPRLKKPKSILDAHKSINCDCGLCGR